VRDCPGAISGIGHAAVITDPQFRTALASHGYILDETDNLCTMSRDRTGAP
jgi:exodeoxyribonuclease V alpha subunit